MKRTYPFIATLSTLLVAIPSLFADDAPTEQSFAAPHDMRMAVKMIGPVTQTTDLQIICVFKHSAAGDKYVEAMQDFNDRLGRLLSSVRDRGEFVGELSETFLFLPPGGFIAPKQVLLVGLGDEKGLSLDRLRIVGRVALREAVRLKAAHVSFAPTIRDQGNYTLDVAEGDRAVAENVVSAYDTEKRLQAQGLAAPFSITDWTIEAGPKFFASTAVKVAEGIHAASVTLEARVAASYVQAAK